ncbi:hypothetical protein [Roseibium sp.]|uniref:hypothetical protein n=1 Tax=Roseibium sp. TaxID=1936156 RepID=UPI00326455C6
MSPINFKTPGNRFQFPERVAIVERFTVRTDMADDKMKMRCTAAFCVTNFFMMPEHPSMIFRSERFECFSNHLMALDVVNFFLRRQRDVMQ